MFLRRRTRGHIGRVREDRRGSHCEWEARSDGQVEKRERESSPEAQKAALLLLLSCRCRHESLV